MNLSKVARGRMKTDTSNRSASRVVSVLRSFSPDQMQMSLAEITDRVKVPKTTTYRIVKALTEGGLLERSPLTEKYTIGPILYALGRLYLGTTDLVKAAEPVIQAQADLTNESVHMGIFVNGYVVTALLVESRHPVRFARPVGLYVPAYASAIGRVFLSHLSDEKLNELYPEENLRKLTEKTVATKTELKRMLERVRETGVAIDQGGGFQGVDGVASAIRDCSGNIVSAITFPVPSYRMNEAYRKLLANFVRLGCNLISYRLGYHDPTSPVHSIEDIRSWWEENKLNLDSLEVAFHKG